MAIQPFGPWRVADPSTPAVDDATPELVTVEWPGVLDEFRPIFEVLASLGFGPPEARAMFLHEVGRIVTPGAMIAKGSRMISLPGDNADSDDPTAGFSLGNVDAREAELLAEFERRRAAAAPGPAE